MRSDSLRERLSRHGLPQVRILTAGKLPKNYNSYFLYIVFITRHGSLHEFLFAYCYAKLSCYVLDIYTRWNNASFNRVSKFMYAKD